MWRKHRESVKGQDAEGKDVAEDKKKDGFKKILSSGSSGSYDIASLKEEKDWIASQTSVKGP